MGRPGEQGRDGMDGKDGEPGRAGEPGQPGTQGQYSCTHTLTLYPNTAQTLETVLCSTGQP